MDSEAEQNNQNLKNAAKALKDAQSVNADLLRQMADLQTQLQAATAVIISKPGAKEPLRMYRNVSKLDQTIYLQPGEARHVMVGCTVMLPGSLADKFPQIFKFAEEK